MKFPSIEEVRKELRAINANVEAECDVRLCVWADGQWTVRYGSADYDRSHADFCGASGIPGVVNGKPARFDSRQIAKDLLEQVKDQWAESQP